MQLFYHPHISEANQFVQFDKEESRHIGKVLRKQAGDIIFSTNGQGWIFEVQLIHVSPKKCEGKVVESKIQQPLPYHLHMAVAPTKLNDRYEWFLEKATEIGVSEITPIICEHSERSVIKMERYEKILQAAMKQSLRAHLPKLNAPRPLLELLDNSSKDTINTIAHCAEGEKRELQKLLDFNKPVLVLIGPEGDFSFSEIETAIKYGFTPIGFGEARLRTETAAIMACSNVALSTRLQHLE